MALTAEEVSSRYPVHWLAWHNQHEELQRAIDSKKFTTEDIELRDPRGRTPLLLAVTLGHIETVRLLLDAGADVNCEKDGWTAVQEATATGNMDLLSLVLSRRDHQRHLFRSRGIPDLLSRLSLAPDFYVEMRWQFTSWMPLLSRVCPSDTYKVYKRGSNVRVDTTLIGFENRSWVRGDMSYVFKGQGTTARFMEVNHEAGTVCAEVIDGAELRGCAAPRPRALRRRLAEPLAINYLDTDKISFERNKSGIWGWRQDKMETVNGYECKVFSANNVEIVSSTRCEHLPRGARRSPRTAPIAGLLGLADEPNDDLRTLQEEESSSSSEESPTEPVAPPTWAEYFSGEALRSDVGRPRDITTKVQKFKATLSLCEDYPLELQEQIMPILDLMTAIASPHFAKLKDFVQMQLPSGFPVKIEIPLFHVMNARITFGNIFGTESAVPLVDTIQEGDRLSCIIDDQCFDIGRGYKDAGTDDRLSCDDSEEGLLQYAIQQSLMEAGTHEDQVDVWEALRGARVESPPAPRPARAPQALLAEDAQLQRAIEASLASLPLGASPLPSPVPAPGEVEGELEGEGEDEGEDEGDLDAALRAALALSAREQSLRDQQLEAEQRALDEALRLSLLDK